MFDRTPRFTPLPEAKALHLVSFTRSHVYIIVSVFSLPFPVNYAAGTPSRASILPAV